MQAREEKRVLDLVSPHFNNLYNVYQKLETLSFQPNPTADVIRDQFPTLSPREAEVLSLLLRGLSAPEVGSRLFIGPRTVETHVAHIYGKLNVRSRREIRVLFDDHTLGAKPTDTPAGDYPILSRSCG